MPPDPHPQPRHAASPWIVLTAGLLLTAASTWALWQEAEDEDRRRLAAAEQAVIGTIEVHLARQIALLRGAAGALVGHAAAQAAAGPLGIVIDAPAFDRFIAGLELRRLHPGVQGMAVALRVEAGRTKAVEAARRAEGAPGYAIHPPGERPLKFPIIYIAPDDERNRAALGFDMYTDEARRTAMDSAIASAMPAASAPVRLKQEIGGEIQNGMVIYVPIYRLDLDLPPERRELVGFITSPIRFGDFFVGIFGAVPDPNLALRVSDGDDVLYATGSPADARLASRREVSVAGRTWVVDVATTAGFDRDSDRALVYGLGIGGALISLLMFILTRSELRAHRRAQRMIVELERSREALLRKAAELSRSNAELEQFAYIASHDLQEPLRMISSYCELIERRYGERLDDAGRRFLGFARDGAVRMRSLINDLLAYLRISGEVERRPCSSQEACRQAIDNLRVAIDDAGAAVTVDRLPEVIADPGQLMQIFQNLLGNALKYRGDRRPEIRVSGRRDGESVEFAVVDNGIGIGSEHFERIFGVFQRLHGENDFSGTGIGLAVCRKLVERSGGRIWVESQVGIGSTFRFTLPAAGGPITREGGLGEA